MTLTTKFKKPKWAADQIIRASGLVEDVCKHGVGHPNRECLALLPEDKRKSYSIHGCDGCCSSSSTTPKKVKCLGIWVTEKEKDIQVEQLKELAPFISAIWTYKQAIKRD